MRYRVFNIFSSPPGSGIPILAECYGRPFRVYSTKGKVFSLAWTLPWLKCAQTSPDSSGRRSSLRHAYMSCSSHHMTDKHLLADRTGRGCQSRSACGTRRPSKKPEPGAVDALISSDYGNVNGV